MVKTLNLKPGETFYDSVCGTGGKLIGAILNMNNYKSTHGKNLRSKKNLATSAMQELIYSCMKPGTLNIKQGDTL